MPFPIGHGLVGATLYTTTQPRISLETHGRMLWLCAALAIAPDIDFSFEWIFHSRGWHRGFTHSFVFGIGLGLVAAWLAPARNRREFFGLLAASVSHAPLDGLVTHTGTGVELLWPFTSHRFQLGFFDYFYFGFDPRFDPWLDILAVLLKVSLIELLVAGPIFLFILSKKRAH